MRAGFILPAVLAATLAAALWPVAARAQATLDRIKESGTITLAYRESSIPFSYLGGDAQPTGMSWEICQRVVANVRKATGRADLKVAQQSVTGQNRIPLLVNGTVDLECCSTTNNTDRARQVAFSANIFYTGTRFLVRSDSGIRGLDDLRGKPVVTTVGTTNMQVLRKLNTEMNLGMDVAGAKDHAESALVLQSRRAIAFGMDDILLYGIRAASPKPDEYVVVGEPIRVEPYALMLRRDDPAFKKLVDETVIGLMKSGEFEAMYKKWFESPIPPRGINLAAPMSKELRENLTAHSDKPTY